MPGWLTIKRDTNVLALFAFLFSTVALGLQVLDYFRGDMVRSLAPEQVLFLRNNQNGRMNLAATISYVNEGALGYSGLVREETVHFTVGGRDYQQHWQQFVTFAEREGKLLAGTPVDAAPFSIPGRGAVSHNTEFAPRRLRTADDRERYRHFLKWDAFVEAVEKERRLVLEFRSRVAGEDDPISHHVVIDFDDALIAHMKGPAGYISPACWAVSGKDAVTK